MPHMTDMVLCDFIKQPAGFTKKHKGIFSDILLQLLCESFYLGARFGRSIKGEGEPLFGRVKPQGETHCRFDTE